MIINYFESLFELSFPSAGVPLDQLDISKKSSASSPLPIIRRNVGFCRQPEPDGKIADITSYCNFLKSARDARFPPIRTEVELVVALHIRG